MADPTRGWWLQWLNASVEGPSWAVDADRLEKTLDLLVEKGYGPDDVQVFA